MMRAKFVVRKVEQTSDTWQNVTLHAVTDKPFDSEGNSEDNTFARYTPVGALTMSINNPALMGKLKEGEKYYLDFTKAD